MSFKLRINLQINDKTLHMKFSTAPLALVFSLLLISCEDAVESNSQIIHREINDQLLVYPDTYQLDVDLDGETDFVFGTRLVMQNEQVHVEYNVYPTRANAVFEIAGRVAVLSHDQPIEPGNPFQKNTAPMVSKIIDNDIIQWQGDWAQVSDKYIGFHFTDFNGIKRYGWINVSFSTETETLFIHEVAYQLKGNHGIKAGDR